MSAKNPLADLKPEIDAARRNRLLIRDPSKRSRTEYLPPLFAFFHTQLPLVAVEGKKNGLFAFALALRDRRKPPTGSSRSQADAFWEAERDKMAAEWGDRAVHQALGIDPLTSEFLRWLDRKHPNLTSKQSFLQNFRDNDWRLSTESCTIHRGDGWPQFEMIVDEEMQPAATRLEVELNYRRWSRTRRVPRSVINPLATLIKHLTGADINIPAALHHYGAVHDHSLTQRQKVADLAAAIMAGEGGQGVPFQQDLALAHDARAIIYKNAAISQFLPP